MSNERPVSLELHHEIEQQLYAEARLLDTHGLRTWLETMLDPSVRYQVAMREERFGKDRRSEESGIIYINDDNFDVLSMRVRQFESGLQTMLDPLPRLRRFVSNTLAFHGKAEGEYQVLSNGLASRCRRLYENEQIVYGREDTWRRDADGRLLLVARRVELDERVSRNKSLLLFL